MYEPMSVSRNGEDVGSREIEGQITCQCEAQEESVQVDKGPAGERKIRAEDGTFNSMPDGLPLNNVNALSSGLERLRSISVGRCQQSIGIWKNLHTGANAGSSTDRGRFGVSLVVAAFRRSFTGSASEIIRFIELESVNAHMTRGRPVIVFLMVQGARWPPRSLLRRRISQKMPPAKFTNYTYHGQLPHRVLLVTPLQGNTLLARLMCYSSEINDDFGAANNVWMEDGPR
ncbi:hypothetical protein C8R43DRAFT_964763 [Mycena crocata]|nr:hypothetical protein C8R43DRAFT_964763 [Mycena crocata]